jgi:hypothetical protein
MNKQQIIDTLVPAGWGIDPWGHLQKEIMVRGTPVRYRIALRKLVARVEILVTHDNAVGSKEWEMRTSAYYKDIYIKESKGRLVIGSIGFKITPK